MKNSAKLDCSAAFNAASAARRSASTGDWAFRRVVVSESAMVVVGLVWACGGLAVIIFWCESER